ncbi:protein O-linked-mannose beta-1,2-N-acetylglucosaminyltransferase 1-like [Liolophura sinensis]|uniref:protein O-linked-mannose beta-1,2-N-acetylglucosaminyltransferase 1-like n=1 Tax=Liolophura sinensis TaxID=3198878 RepID=UPI003159064C
MSPNLGNGGRGLNMVVVDDITAEIVGTFTVDTYIDDTPLIRYIRTKLADNHIVMIASFDEVSSKLNDARRLLKKLGSNQADSIKFRDSFMMIGQKNLDSGYAIEYHNRMRSGFAKIIEKSGCFSIPMGPLENRIDSLQSAIILPENMKIGEPFPNCGLPESCPTGSVSGLVYTGKGNTEGPQICLDGKYVSGTDLNDGGRGFNIVVLDPRSKKIVKMARFDTYETDSSPLEMFLEDVWGSQIIIAVTADESSKKLSVTAKELLQEFGSSMIESLRFRDVWYLVGQKMLDGFSTIEQISFAGPDGQWPKPLTHSFCIPTKLKSTKVMPDPLVWRNDEKRAFCKENDGYVDFCDPAHVDDQYKPVPLMEKSLEGNDIYSSPIIIVPGLNHNSLVKTLETTSMQSGINPEMVFLLWDEQFPEYADLADIFGFKDIRLPSQKSYENLLLAAIKKVWSQFHDKNYIIVLEEEILLGPDFLLFMAQCKEALDKDESLLAVSAWNPNGYETMSGNVSQLLRVEDFPGLGFLMKRSAFEKYLQPNLATCCNNRAWDGWNISQKDYVPQILIPDLSRVYRQPYKGAHGMDDYYIELFQRPRATNLHQRVFVAGVASMVEQQYDNQIANMLRTSTTLTLATLPGCLEREGSAILPQKGAVYSVVFTQKDANDFRNLRKLCRCFGLFSSPTHPPKGLYKGVLRFNYQYSSVMLLSSLSPFQKTPGNSTQSINVIPNK